MQPDAHARCDEREGEHGDQEPGDDLAEPVAAHLLVRQALDLGGQRLALGDQLGDVGRPGGRPVPAGGPPTGAVGSSGPIASMADILLSRWNEQFEPYLRLRGPDQRNPPSERSGSAVAARGDGGAPSTSNDSSST